eukprot:TRINITY_DN18653_c0_g1_i1.p1 TRINITY_DN18653_c0_g1~~TRINITY_DN18653_c0_g1_i1.p1  ORF type:complete len:216 (-),score=45.78 TRINITY_DN18653_c0_g1_i1:39-656(-)
MGQSVQCAQCSCKGSLTSEMSTECIEAQISKLEDASDFDGDVKNTEAMRNHKLLAAARDGDDEALELLLQQGADIDVRRPFVMTFAEHSADADNIIPDRACGLTPLMYACQGGYVPCVELLLKARANVHAEEEDGLRPLHFAASASSLPCCELLIARGAKVNAVCDEGQTALDLVPPVDMRTAGEKRLWHELLPAEAPEERQQAG